MGLLATEASSGWEASSIASASALRALADDCDADLDAFHEPERAERDLDG